MASYIIEIQILENTVSLWVDLVGKSISMA